MIVINFFTNLEKNQHLSICMRVFLYFQLINLTFDEITMIFPIAYGKAKIKVALKVFR